MSAPPEPIRTDGPTPAWRLVADRVAADIEAGAAGYRPDDRITEQTLHARFGVGRTTARHALAHLRERGLVYTVAKRGSYVRGQG